MNPRRGLVLDANILMRAVLGRRVRAMLERYEDSAAFHSPDVCFEDARDYLSQVLKKRGLDLESGRAILEQISQLVMPVDRSLYGDYARLAPDSSHPIFSRVAGHERCSAVNLGMIVRRDMANRERKPGGRIR